MGEMYIGITAAALRKTDMMIVALARLVLVAYAVAAMNAVMMDKSHATEMATKHAKQIQMDADIGLLLHHAAQIKSVVVVLVFVIINAIQETNNAAEAAI
jgi:hypothetical protein